MLEDMGLADLRAEQVGVGDYLAIAGRLGHGRSAGIILLEPDAMPRFRQPPLSAVSPSIDSLR